VFINVAIDESKSARIVGSLYMKINVIFTKEPRETRGLGFSVMSEVAIVLYGPASYPPLIHQACVSMQPQLAVDGRIEILDRQHA